MLFYFKNLIIMEIQELEELTETEMVEIDGGGVIKAAKDAKKIQK